jgi:serine/threonine protein kinase
MSSDDEKEDIDEYRDDFEITESKFEESQNATLLSKEEEDQLYTDDFEPSPTKHTIGSSSTVIPLLSSSSSSSSSIESIAPISNHKVSSTISQWEDAKAEDIKTGRQLGGGGFAVVFEGTYRGLPGKSVAIKMIIDPSTSKENLNAFMDELHTMAKLNHPNIVRLIAASTRPPRQCFIMELCGPTLFDVLHNKVIPRDALEEKRQTSNSSIITYITPKPSQRLTWALSVARALAYLHSLRPVSLIHRDIKSNNVLLCGPDGQSCKLSDFGLVGTRETNSGTPAYMAPELHSSKPFSKMVDVYAFGVLLWEILVQQVPFDGRRPDDIRSRVLAGERPSGVSVQPLLSSLSTISTTSSSTQIPIIPKALLGAGEAMQSAALLAARCWETRPTLRPDMITVVDELTKLVEKQLHLEEIIMKNDMKDIHNGTTTSTTIWSRHKDEKKRGEKEEEEDSLTTFKR